MTSVRPPIPKWLWIVGIVVLIGLVAQCAGRGIRDKSSSPSASSSSASTSESTTTASAKPVKATRAIPGPLNLIQQKWGIKVNAVDIGRYIVDGVDNERAIFDSGNWRIVAQCDYMLDNTLNVGVIKTEEFAIIQQANQGKSIMENFFISVLDCPADKMVPAESTTATATRTSESPAPSTRPAPTNDQVKQAFQAYIDERSSSGVMMAWSVTSVTVADGVVTVTADPAPVVLETSPFQNLAEFFGTPVVFNSDEGIWLRETVQRVDVVDTSGQSLGSMTAAELNKKATG